MKEKLVTASSTENCSKHRKYCCEYFKVSEYLIWSDRELKQRKGILAQPSRKVKQWPRNNLSCSCFLWGWWIQLTASWQKNYVSIQKGVYKQKWLVLCNLHELFVAFKELEVWKSDSPSFVLSTVNGVSLQVHQEHTWYVSVLLIKTLFC